MSIAVIINPISGGARPETVPARARIAAAIAERCGEHAEVLVTERAGHARELTAAAVGRGARLVIAWGGDGTLNEVASALAFGEIPLGIVPAGSGNGLARELGVPFRPEEALVRAIQATPSPIDVGALDGRVFVNMAGIGLDAHVAWTFNAARNEGRGLANYLKIGARALFSYQPASYSIDVDGERLSPRALVIVIANSAQYGNNARIAPGARVDDGELNLVVLEERSRLATICRTPRLFNGTVARVRGYTMRRMREATIESAAPMMFHVDGEAVQGGTSLVARVHPAALQIAL